MKSLIPTLKEVADKANISIRTVSRVLNDSELVNKKTKVKVLKVIKELNYKPNLVARSLKCKKSHCIGIVVDDLRSPYYGPIIKEIELIAYKNNYSIFICNSEFDHKIQERHMENLISRAVDGIIITPLEKDFKYLEKIAQMGIKIVAYGYFDASYFKYKHNNLSCVSENERVGILKAINYLVDNGHKRIIFINGKIKNYKMSSRLEGYKDALTSNNIDFEEKFVFNTTIDIDGGYEAAKRIFKNNNFTSIVCYNDLIAMGIYKYCSENKIKIPDDFSIIGYDNIFCSQFLNPPLTTINSPKATAGKKLMELLFMELNNKEIKDNIIELLPDLLIRNSVKKIL